jgi:hypothetical protein
MSLLAQKKNWEEAGLGVANRIEKAILVFEENP